MNQRLVSILSLFTSMSTLICCALPALFVALGAGASLVGLLGSFPQLIWFSENKEVVFGISGLLIGVSLFMHWRAKKESCPVDPAQAKACAQAKSWSGPVLWISLGIYTVGFFFAFLAPIIL